jgi:enoyl-CoA hydratase/carnithine racemase
MDGGTAMESGNLIVKDDGHLTRITLNRPEKRNALSHGLLSEMIPALRSVTTPVVAIEGAGPCLSAGHDLSEMTGRPLSFYQELGAIYTEVMETIQGIPQPVVAKVHGFATAAGCQLVAACDLAVAAEGTWFATPGVKVGMFCSTPMVELSRAVGRKRAMEMLLTGTPIDTATAAEWGLINRVVSAGELTRRWLTWPQRSPPPARWSSASGSRPSTVRSTSTSARPTTSPRRSWR